MTTENLNASHQEDDGANGAISIREFCKRNSIGVTTAYSEINAGHLVARKCRSRTLIDLADERAWRSNLPKIRP
jgi:hypothetical protein